MSARLALWRIAERHGLEPTEAILDALRAAYRAGRDGTGRPRGRSPYGADATRAEVADWIAEMRSDGATLVAIAAELNEAGITTRSGRQWTSGSVDGVLRRSASATRCAPRRRSPSE